MERSFFKCKYKFNSNLEYNGNSLASVISHYLNNNLSYSNISNYDILFAYDLNDDTFSFSDSLTNYKKINLNLRIGENENLLRYLILSLTFKGGLILLGLRYLSFYREYIIIKELGIPFYKSRFCLILVLEICLFLIFQ